MISFLLLEYRHHLETEELEPLIIRNTIPLCMGQYERTFKSTRSDSFSNVQGRVQVPLPLVPHVLISTLILFLDFLVKRLMNWYTMTIHLTRYVVCRCNFPSNAEAPIWSEMGSRAATPRFSCSYKKKLYIFLSFQHLVVFCNGNFYEVKVSDSYGSPITLLDLERQLEWIKHDAQHSDSE